MDDARGTTGDDAGTDMPDVSVLPLRRLIDSDDSVLANSLRRLIADLEQTPPERYAAFGSAT